MELKAKKKTTPPTQQPSTAAPADQTVGAGDGGASAAVGVLTAVDEDVEGGEEAELPEPFDVVEDDEEMQG